MQAVCGTVVAFSFLDENKRRLPQGPFMSAESATILVAHPDADIRGHYKAAIEHLEQSDLNARARLGYREGAQ